MNFLFNGGGKIIESNRATIYLSLSLAIFLTYSGISSFSFINYDDPMYVNENTLVLSGFTLNSFFRAFNEVGSNWHPVTILSHMLDFQLFGLNPGMHHLISLFIHVANSLLLLLLLENMTASFWRSFVVAALFALHPLHVESVVWIAERKDVLSTFFGLLSLLSYFYYVTRKNLGFYFLSLFCFLLALMSKPMLVSLPCLIVLIDYWPLKRLIFLQGIKGKILNKDFYLSRIIIEKIPFVFLSFLFCAIAVWTQYQAGTVGSIQEFSIFERISNSLSSYIIYIYKTILPINLAVVYPFPKDPQLILAIFSLLILVGLTWFSFKERKNKAYLIVGWLWYLITLLPVIGIIQVGVQAMADRYTYLPSVGIFIIIVWWIADIAAENGTNYKIVIGGTVFIIAALATMTWAQTNKWMNSVTIFEHTLKTTKNNYIAHNNLGRAYEVDGRLDEAIEQYQLAIRIKPDFFLANYNLGGVLLDVGQFENAIVVYRRTIKLAPNVASVYYNYGNALFHKGNIEEAADKYLHTLSIDPKYLDAHFNLGVIRAKQNRTSEAVLEYQQELLLNNRNARCYNNLGVLYMRSGQTSKAISNFRTALMIDSTLEESIAYLKILIEND